MPRTRHEVKELRTGVEEVERLRYEKEQHRLAEVAQNAHHGERHARKVAVGVADEHFGGVPVVVEQRAGDRQKRQHEVQRE